MRILPCRRDYRLSKGGQRTSSRTWCGRRHPVPGYRCASYLEAHHDHPRPSRVCKIRERAPNCKLGSSKCFAPLISIAHASVQLASHEPADVCLTGVHIALACLFEFAANPEMVCRLLRWRFGHTVDLLITYILCRSLLTSVHSSFSDHCLISFLVRCAQQLQSSAATI